MSNNSSFRKHDGNQIVIFFGNVPLPGLFTRPKNNVEREDFVEYPILTRIPLTFLVCHVVATTTKHIAFTLQSIRSINPSIKMSIVLIDATSNSLTVSWPESQRESSVRYVLQYRKAIDSDNEVFETLSDKLTSSQARKRNLVDPEGTGFLFRVGSVDANSLSENGDSIEKQVKFWITHLDPFHLLSEEQQVNRIQNAPKVLLAGNHRLLVSWDGYNGSETKYEIQMRENNGGEEWKTIAPSFAGTNVKKKNLTSDQGYQFRVRPTTSETVFSPPSDPMVALGLSDGIKRLFRSLDSGTLLRSTKEPPIPLAEALGGKEIILLYASAHWCGPCRQFTPSLIQWYNSLPSSVRDVVEVVFLSADHNESGFRDYYGSMPWLAVDFDEDAREEIMGVIRVSGIPRLAVLDGRTGRIIEDNAVGKPFDINRWRSLMAKK